MKRAGLLLVLGAAVVLSGVPASADLPDTSTPELDLARTIQTTPFAGSSVSMKDHEGSAYVPFDNSLWLADDNGKAIYEIDPGTGALKRSIGRSIFNAAPLFEGGPNAGTERTNDFESIAYDAWNDLLYVFSGPCCNTSILPTAFRLVRVGEAFEVESYQPLDSTANYTGAAWNPADGMLYVGRAQQLRTYDYVTNMQGATFGVSGVSGITGMVFTPDGADLFVTVGTERLMRVRWATKTLVNGWTFDLTPFGVLDSRAVELINDQFYVSDGADTRPGDPLSKAVFVFNVTGPPTPPPTNLVANPGFEVDMSGWSTVGSGNGVALSLVSPGRDGSIGAARLTNGAGGNRKCLLTDDPDSVPSTTAGLYTASIWVRGEVAGALIKIKIREMNGASVVKSRVKNYTLTTSWQQITVTHTPLSPGGSSLDLQVFLPRAYAPPGHCFDADDASIILS